ncbi:hypothetical protein C8Q78DRAFT_1031131 [Trametes maxima]|nr:hypothetical protein C8Q78DRAFT_1031131 [Trametes maxima]
MSSHQPQYSYSLPPPMQDAVRLPSIKDLNFPPPGQDGASANGSGRAEHARPRHETTSWSRSNASTGPPPPQHPPQPQHSQHSSAMPPPHNPPPKSHAYAPQKHDASYSQQGPGPSPQQPSGGAPTHNGMSAGPTRAENGTDPSSKRSRSQAGVGASPGRSPHTAYPPYPSQAPPPGYHAGPPPPPPQAHPTHEQRYHAMPPPPPPPHHQPPPPSPYPPAAAPPPQEHWQQHPQSQPPPPPPSQQFNGFTRTTPLVPAPVESRPNAPNAVDTDRAATRQNMITEILKHCGVLYGFANHYAATPQAHAQPGLPEIEEMNWRASIVMRLLDDLRRLDAGEDVTRKENVPVVAPPPEEPTRPPKRPWEDMARDGDPPSAGYSDAQSTAEQDMAIIRNKRQSSTGGAQPGQQKNKYRKRSVSGGLAVSHRSSYSGSVQRATPPGKCHSCNIRETPEWRRGPDGARTLCNACGLHYAKLMRKRDKALDANGKAPPIDLQTLRASTASARGSGSNGGGDHGGEPSHSQPHPPPSPYDPPKPPPMHAPPPPHAHQGPYQLMPVGAPGPSGQPHQMMPPLPPHGSSAPHSANGAPVPPPPWMSSSAAERSAYPAEPQSYMRASHPPSHARASPQ